MNRGDTTVWERDNSECFEFVSRSLDLASGRVTLSYRLDGITLEETIVLPVSVINLPDLRQHAVEQALDLLHWVAGVSYWKAGCPTRLVFRSTPPDAWQAVWLTRLYREGLGEFAFRNHLDPEQWPLFLPGEPETGLQPAAASGLSRRTLVPMGGGKDSLVAWSRLVSAGEQPDSVQIGSSDLIRRIGAHLAGRHWEIERRLDPALGELNQRGAWNGHVPVSAINASILVLAALVLDYDRIAFANERSADEASLIDSRGRAVNHQFSKSFAFEQMLDEWVRNRIDPDLRVFSLLRQDRELAVCREFARLTRFHDLFSSCNRNFHLDGPRTGRWCGRCPKCHFVFLALAPFMLPERLDAIFGRDLLADAELADDFAALLALDGQKPFECVGEAVEARAAVRSLAQCEPWSAHAVVRILAERLEGIEGPDLEQLCLPGGSHLIPEEWRHAA
jgi:UDP-N-acetyl-alpha-D-muramoyl-L-alanyl-L-glutamate epimerase